jgi:hypothetical protein
MESGYVLDFSDRTLGEFVEEAVTRDIHSERYPKLFSFRLLRTARVDTA